MFKILSTIAVGILSTAWAWQNFRFINDWFVGKTGIGITSEERMRLRQERLASSNTDVTPSANT